MSAIRQAFRDQAEACAALDSISCVLSFVLICSLKPLLCTSASNMAMLQTKEIQPANSIVILL